MQIHKTAITLATLCALSSCNSSSTLKVEESATPSNNQTTVASIGNDTGAQITDARYKIHFLPITGAPKQQVANLSKALQSSAIQNKIAMVNQNQGEAYRIKGFFSAFNDGNGTLVVYVWDVLDNNNNRKHRINGRQKINKTAGNAWQTVDATVMNEIGKTTIQKINKWASQQK